MKTALIGMLLDHQPLTALVGQRINWSRRAQGQALPCVILEVIASVPAVLLNRQTTLKDTMVQIDTYATTVASADAVASAIKSALDGLATIRDGIMFQGVFARNEQGFLETGDTAEDRIYRVSLDYSVIWRPVA